MVNVIWQNRQKNKKEDIKPELGEQFPLGIFEDYEKRKYWKLDLTNKAWMNTSERISEEIPLSSDWN